MVSRRTIDEISRKIVERFRPEKIILFGSYARGEATEDSDVDLLVVSRSPGPRGKRSAPMIRMLAEEYDLPIDIVVRSPEGLEEWKDVRYSLAHVALTEGITLYDKTTHGPGSVVS